MASEPPGGAAPPAPADGPVVAGDWHPARSSRSVAAVVALRSGAVVARDVDGNELAACERRALTISPRVGAIPRRLVFPDGSVFETDDNDAVDRLAAEIAGRSGGRVGDLLHRAEAFHPRLVGFVVLAVLFAVVIYSYALPALVEVAVAVTPPVVPELMSQGTLTTLDELVLGPSRLPESERAAIAADFEALAAASRRGADGLSLHFRRGGSIGPNAFALPDGTIVVTDELVGLAGGDREVVLAVLAHEIGHVEEEHSLRQLYRAAGIAGLVMLIGGDMGEGVEDLLVQGGGLLALSYSRAHEEAADRYAVALMMRAGRDPTALARFFEVLQRRYGDSEDTDFLSTHPGTPERRRRVIEHAREVAGEAP